MRIRLEKLLEALGVNQTEFCRSTGISKSRLSEVLGGRTNNLSVDALQSICNTYPNVNPTWLLTGEGEMFLSSSGGSSNLTNRTGSSSSSVSSVTEVTRSERSDKYQYRLDEEEKELIELLRSKKKGKEKIYIALKALLGLGALFFFLRMF